MLCSVSLITSCIQIILVCKSIIIYTFIVSTQEDLKYWCRMHSLILWLSKFIIFKCIQVRHFISLFIPCFLWTELAYAGTYHHVIRYFMCDLVIRMWSSILRIISQLHLCLSLFALMSQVLQNSMDVLVSELQNLRWDFGKLSRCNIFFNKIMILSHNHQFCLYRKITLILFIITFCLLSEIA